MGLSTLDQAFIRRVVEEVVKSVVPKLVDARLKGILRDMRSPALAAPPASDPPAGDPPASAALAAGNPPATTVAKKRAKRAKPAAATPA